MAIKNINGLWIFENDNIKFRKCLIMNNFNFNVLFLNHCRFIFQLPDGRIEGHLSNPPKSWTLTLNNKQFGSTRMGHMLQRKAQRVKLVEFARLMVELLLVK